MKISVTCFEKPSPYVMRQSFTAIASSLVCLCCGLTLGITGVILPQLRDDKNFSYDDSYESWIASISALSMVLGALCVGTILDVYGRKKAHIILNVPNIFGWLIIAYGKSSTYILIGRFITGFSAGASRPLSLVYIGEISDPKYRPIALFLSTLCVMIGILLSHIIGTYLPWRLSALILIAPSFAILIPICFIKESPLWLITKGRIREGTELFRWFRGSDNQSEMELTAALERHMQNESNANKEVMNVIFSRSFIKPFLILTILVINMQFSGTNALNFYAQDIFENTFGGKIDAFAVTIAADCIKAVMAIFLCSLGKSLPRKKAYIAFNLCLVLSSVILFAYIEYSLVDYFWLSVVSLLVYLVSTSAMLTIGWSFAPEIMPNKVRGLGSGLVSALAYLTLFICVKVTPDIIKSFGQGAMYVFFAIMCFITIIYLAFTVPDTNGKTLQSIEDTLNNKNNADKSVVANVTTSVTPKEVHV